jgi:hypothetical protein
VGKEGKLMDGKNLLHFEVREGEGNSPNFIMAKTVYRGSQERTNRITTRASIFTTLIFDCC